MSSKAKQIARQALITSLNILLSFLVLPLEALIAFIEMAFRKNPFKTVEEIGPSFDGIIGVSIYKWEEIVHRPQQTFMRLSRKFKCIYIRPVFQKYLLVEKSLCVINKFRRKNENLIVMEPLLLSGSNFFKFVEEINRWLIKAYVRRYVRKMGIKAPVLWYHFPHLLMLRGQLNERLTVYDILDEYSGFKWARERNSQREEILLRESDVIFAGTEALYRAKKREKNNIYFLPCGVEFEHFAKARTSSPIPEDIAEISGIKLGYFGMVDERIDQDLCLEMVNKHPNWHIILIGPILGDFSRLKANKNIHLLGARPYQSLPSYLAHWDISLIPFRIYKVTEHINPTKLLEYFVARKPVVTSAIPDIIKFYSDIAYIGYDRGDFILKCELALKHTEDRETRLDKGVEIARNRSWEAFIDFMLEKMELARRIKYNLN